jgi:hypothetical protein
MIRTLKRPRENFWTDSDVSLLYQLRSEMPDASYKVIADQFNARGPDQTRKPDAVRGKLNSSPPSEKSYYFFRQGILGTPEIVNGAKVVLKDLGYSGSDSVSARSDYRSWTTFVSVAPSWMGSRLDASKRIYTASSNSRRDPEHRYYVQYSTPTD